MRRIITIFAIILVPFFFSLFYYLGQEQVASLLALLVMAVSAEVALVQILRQELMWRNQEKAFNQESIKLSEILHTFHGDEALRRCREFKQLVEEKYNAKNNLLFTSFLSPLIDENSASASAKDRLEIISHLSSSYDDKAEVDFQWAKYIVWLIPTVGFFGTVWGIRYSFGGLGDVLDPRQSRDALDAFLSQFSVAFETTIFALLFSAILYGVVVLHEWGRRTLLVEITEFFRTDTAIATARFFEEQNLSSYSRITDQLRDLAPKIVSAAEALSSSAINGKQLIDKVSEIRGEISRNASENRNVIVNQVEVITDRIQKVGSDDRSSILSHLLKIEDSVSGIADSNRESAKMISDSIKSNEEIYSKLLSEVINLVSKLGSSLEDSQKYNAELEGLRNLLQEIDANLANSLGRMGGWGSKR